MANVDLIFRILGKDQTGAAIKSATGNLSGLEKASDKARKTATALKGALAGLAIGAAVGTAFKKSVTAASDLEQAMGSLEAVFKGNTSVMEANAKAATKIGLSQARYAQSAAILGAQLGNLGVSQEDLAGTTDGLMTSAADLAAQFGGTTADAVDALGALFRGERDPIEKYGISINDAAIKAEMAATGLDKTQATMSLLNKQMEASGTIGAAAREMDTLAGSTGRMGATMENAFAQIGSTQLPVMAKLADMFEKITPSISDALTPAFAALGNVALDALEGIEANLPAIQEGIGDFAKKVNEIGPAVERNWPQIKDTFNNVAAALERVSGFTKVMWDAFQSLPPEVKQVLAMLAVAQKTGVINVAFKGAELVEGLVSNISAATVYVTGPVAGGAPGAGARGAAGAAGVGGVVAGAGPLVGALAAVWRGFDLVGKTKELFAGDMGLGDYFKDVILGPWGASVFNWLSETTATARRVVGTAFVQMKNDAIAKVGEMSTGVKMWFEGIGANIRDFATRSWNVMVMFWTNVKNDATNKVREMWASVTGWFTNLRLSIGSAVSGAYMSVAQEFTNLKNAAVDRARETWGSVTGWFTGLASGIGGIFTGMVDNIGRIWNNVTNVVKRPISLMFGWINRNMIIPINNVLGKFSDKITLGFLSVGAYADGGYVTGPGGPRDDRIPAMLSNGEFVVNAAATRANRVALEALNAGKQGFGIGGPMEELENLLAKGAALAIRAVSAPPLALLDRLFGGEWSPDTVIAGMRNVVDSAVKWGENDDATATGAYKGPRGPVQRPLNSYVVTSEWMRSGADMRHFGIDLGAPLGTPIFAAANGRLIPVTGYGWNGGYGNMATIDHGTGLKTIYAHMFSLSKAVGAIVRAGQQIGTVGSTGMSTGPHLHFETHRNGRPVDPRSVLGFDRGGYLQPGYSLVFNGTSKPEPILTSAQWSALTQSKAKEATSVEVYIDGRMLHDSLVRYKRSQGGAALGLA